MDKSQGKLAGKIALITGGTSGIGLATAKLFEQEGAQVIVTGRGAAALSDAKQKLSSSALVLQSDAGKLADVRSLIAEIKSKFGRIDALFANAGVGFFVPFEQVTEESFDSQFNINVKGLYFTVQEALPLIPDGGAILLNASVAASKGFSGSTVYSATKAAVRSLGRTLATELAPRRIRVNTVSPGPVETPIFTKMGMSEEQARQAVDGMAQGVALKRAGQPEEIAHAALFLLSSDSAYVTGAELLVDGGLAAL
jgi:NAD(P)-dependent dehydrogenase (short-subunit alcohol dehydrogenase family)